MAERPLACEAWQPTLAGWLMAQLPPEEEAQLVAHLEGCPACRAEADSLMHVAALTLGADAGAQASGEASARVARRSDRRAGRSRATGARSPHGWPWR